MSTSGCRERTFVRERVVDEPIRRSVEMTEKREGLQRDPSKDRDDWTTGDEPMTGPQESYLETLAQEAGEDLPHDLSKAEASAKIDRLQNATGRDG
jgi:hypothetical protein